MRTVCPVRISVVLTMQRIIKYIMPDACNADSWKMTLKPLLKGGTTLFNITHLRLDRPLGIEFILIGSDS